MPDFSFLRERKLLFVLAGILVFLLTLLGGRMFFEYLAEKNPPDENDLAKRSIEDLVQMPIIDNEVLPADQKISPLTGLEINPGSGVRPIDVMIENLPASRPQMRGLDEATIVIEALAEGGITRYLAIFDVSENKKVGPVRSARPYFVDWAEEFGGAFVHAGGSEDALAKLAKSKLHNFDEDGKIVYRDFQYLKPHNLFVNLGLVRAEKFTNEPIKSWFDFAGEIPGNAAAIKQFSLDFSLPEYLVDYVYDATIGKYKRLLGGSEQRAGTNPLQPTNIIVQFTEYFPIDESGRLQLKTSGEGAAWFFSEGKMWRGVWRKIGNRTKFFDSAGSSVSLNPGQTFIEVLDSAKRVSLPQQ
ncbi:MAG: DUF3048 domain-containing protein [Patescibacteria group bacterium]